MPVRFPKGPRRPRWDERPAWIQRDDDYEFGFPDENIKPLPEVTKVAKERKIPEFTPEQMEQIQAINQRVLNKPADEPRPVAKPIAPRPMLPNYYKKGGPVNKFEFVRGGPRMPGLNKR